MSLAWIKTQGWHSSYLESVHFSQFGAKFMSIHVKSNVAIICQNDELTWAQLSSNPWLFLVLILEASEMSKKFRVKSLSINYLDLKNYIHTRDWSKFWSEMKTRKSQGLLLSCTQVNSSFWQIIATPHSRRLEFQMENIWDPFL